MNLLTHAHPELQSAKYVAFADSARRYLDCSDGVCELLGYSREELLAKTVDDVSFHVAEVCDLFAEYLKRGKLEGEYVLRHKSGTPIPIKFKSFVFPDGCNAAIWEPIKDWREPYLAALVETDDVKLKQRIAIASAAVQARQRNDEYKSGGSHIERQALSDAAQALSVMRRDLERKSQPGAI